MDASTWLIFIVFGVIFCIIAMKALERLPLWLVIATLIVAAIFVIPTIH